jgi:hypothetical protein
MFVCLLVLQLRVRWCPLALPSWRSSSNPAARRGTPAPAGAAAPVGSPTGGIVGRLLVRVSISSFSCCTRGCRRYVGVSALGVSRPIRSYLVSRVLRFDR